MRFNKTLCLIRGGGDLATGVVYRLHRAGFPVVVIELPQPLAVRRTVAFAEAVYAGEIIVENVLARKAKDSDEALHWIDQGLIPVVVDGNGDTISSFNPAVLVDGRMAKVNLGTQMNDAKFVVAIGPGFTAGRDCHVVVETQRGHRLGRVFWQGSAAPNTGQPESVQGYIDERVLRAPRDGKIKTHRKIGDLLLEGEICAEIQNVAIKAPFNGILRGIIHDGVEVTSGMKVGDIDPQKKREYCYEISDKALAIGGGVLEAVLTWMNSQE